MVQIGLIGVGFMGMTHFEAARRLKGGRIAAIATRSSKKLAGDWTDIQGNFGPRGGQVDLSKVRKYADYELLLRDPEIDLVDICLPTAQHEDVVLDALTAGKHVIVEKPIAIDLAAADRMVAAAKKAKRMLMVGHVLPFFPEFRFAAEAISAGKYGKLQAGHFRRVISTPDWSADMANLAMSGGPGIDLHIHDTHFIAATCGLPSEVRSRGILEQGYAQYLTTQYVFGNAGPIITCNSGGVAAAGLAFTHGYELYFERGSIQFEAGTLGGNWVVTRPCTVFSNKGTATPAKLKIGKEWCSGFTDELQLAVSAVSSGEGKEPLLLSGTLARDALKLCVLESRSISTGKPVAVKG